MNRKPPPLGKRLERQLFADLDLSPYITPPELTELSKEWGKPSPEYRRLQQLKSGLVNLPTKHAA